MQRRQFVFLIPTVIFVAFLGAQPLTPLEMALDAADYHETALDAADYHAIIENPKPTPLPSPPEAHPRPTGMLDMDDMASDFILETKKIEIPGYPRAFNPSIIRWRGSLLMTFRVLNPVTGSANPFALVWLDEDFNPVSQPQFFELPYHNPVLPSKQQDPRLIELNGRLILVYNNQHENIIHREMRRVCLVEMDFDGEKFIPGTPEYILEYEGKSEGRSEKNWVPFEYNGQLLLAYSLLPHKILRPFFGTSACETFAISQAANINWEWGQLRGGTQALRDGDHYLSFFHSWRDVPTVQSNGKKISHYVMGAYTFEAHPPFSITAISPHPIVAKDFYQPPYYRTWKPLRCVFPAGMLIDDNYVWITYGRQDNEIWVAKLDKKRLLNSLIPVENLP